MAALIGAPLWDCILDRTAEPGGRLFGVELFDKLEAAAA
jgi:hypothetical protein